MNGTWREHAVAGKRVEVYTPPGGAAARFAVLYLHSGGLETLAGQDAFTRLFDELRLACVCPHGGMSWWADRRCAEFDPALTPERWLLDSVMPFLRSELGFAPPAVGLLGVSMGGQGALRLAFKHPKTFPVVAAIAASIEFQNWYGLGYALDQMYDSKEQARQDTALLHIHPNDYPSHVWFRVDPTDREWWRGNDRLHEKLAALGVPHHCDLTTRAGGHSWDYFNAMAEDAVRFLDAGLSEMARRLL
ncbi:MAG: alpha/beta hydrolase-fold protein [Gemmataceae bacterium]